MKRILYIVALAVFASACSRMKQAEPVVIAPPAAPDPEVTALIQKASHYKFGESREALTVIQDKVRAMQGQPEKNAPLRQGLAAMTLTDSTPESKQFACRQLALIGTADEVPALSGFLSTDKSGDSARIALERIPGPAAGATLRAALAGSEGKRRIGIINSIGERREQESIAVLAPMLDAKDSEQVEAAAAALGKIGGEKSAAALSKKRSHAPAESRSIFTDNLLLCADQLLATGQEAKAAAIYDQCKSADEPTATREAALRGFVTARGEKAIPLVADLLKSEEPKTQAHAVSLVRLIPGSNATREFGQELGKLPPHGKALLIRALGDRGDAEAMPFVVKEAASENEDVRVAALRALGKVGDDSTVDLLMHAAAKNNGAESDAARDSLTRMKGTKAGDVENAMAGILQKSQDAGMRAEAVRTLGARRASYAAPALLKATKDPDTGVRLESYKALGLLADERLLPGLIDSLKAEKNEEARTEAEKAVVLTAGKIKDPNAQAAPVLSALRATSDTGTYASLLRVTGQIGGPDALKVLLDGLKDKRPAVKSSAVDAVAAWPDGGPADSLLSVASTESEGPIRLRAWGGYAKLLALPSDRKDDETLKLYSKALEQAKTTEEKNAVVTGLGGLRNAGALKLVGPLLSKKEHETAAASAAVSISQAVGGSFPGESKALMKKVIETTKDAELRKRAEGVLRNIEKFDDYVTAWEVAGPYTQKDKNGDELFRIPFDPEKPEAKNVKWALMPVGTDRARPWLLDFNKIFAGDNQAAYLRTRVWSPKDQDAKLELGSDDGVKVWLNGKVVHENNATRPLTPGDDKVNVKLAKGWNDLMLKVTNGGGQWEACARLRSPDGGPLNDIRAEAGEAPKKATTGAPAAGKKTAR